MQGIESLPTIAEDLGIRQPSFGYDYDTFAQMNVLMTKRLAKCRVGRLSMGTRSYALSWQVWLRTGAESGWLLSHHFVEDERQSRGR